MVWLAQFGYIEDMGEGRGYTAGIIGFCSGTGDMLDLIRLYGDWKPGNAPAIQCVVHSAEPRQATASATSH